MASAEQARRSPFSDHRHPGGPKTLPILTSSAASSSAPPAADPMEVTPSSSAQMAPPGNNSPGGDRNGANRGTTGESEPAPNGNAAPAIGAAAAAQQPKVVQTAFIHKLYNMLEDQSIQHLISWSSSNESFVMSPSNEFSKVLSSYFKHTNISSFVRQLNMYGFHKVSDVFHTGSPDSPLWEFKHGNGNFKRGDLVGLREIKRRASRHALIHRDSFSTGPKTNAPPTGAPVEPMPDPIENRLSILEYNFHDLHARLARSEDSYAYVNQRCQALSDGLARCHQWNIELTNYLLAMIPDPENPIHKDVAAMRNEVIRQSEILRSMDSPEEPMSARQPYFGMLTENGPPLSPRQLAQDGSRRPSMVSNSRGPATLRPPVASHLAASPRRYGSIGTGGYSPSSARAPAPPPPPPPVPTIQHPHSSSVLPPANLSRRHTSADIRLHGWQSQPPAPSPYGSGHNSTQWPSSPHRGPIGENQQLREALAQYELPRGPRQQGSRQATPPMGHDPGSTLAPDSGWTLPGARYPFRGVDTPGPPTRRSSMASNVHSLLNPAETAERADEDEQNPDDRKRKRLT